MRGMITVATGLLLSTVGYLAWHVVVPSAPTPRERPQAFPPSLVLSGNPDSPADQSPAIRVCLTPNPVTSLELAIDGPFSVQVVGNDQPLGTAPKLAASRAECAGQNVRVGSRSYRATRLEIVPRRSPAIWVNGHQYRGRVRLFRQPGGKLLAVNVLPLEEYLASVIDSEMPAAFPQAARQAQAICSRTYAVYQMRESRAHPYFDLYNSTRSQKYLGYQYQSNGRRLAGETDAGRQVAHATRGLVCTYRGQVFCTYYSAVCGGGTTPGDWVFRDAAPPLKPVACDWCREAPLYRWTEQPTKQDTAKKLKSAGSWNGLKSIQRADNGPLTPASLFHVSDGKTTARVSATELRRLLSLASSRFQVRQHSNQPQSRAFCFDGRGHGHGVGLCQWGARGLALAGKSAREIISYYYPGSELARGPD